MTDATGLEAARRTYTVEQLAAELYRVASQEAGQHLAYVAAKTDLSGEWVALAEESRCVWRAVARRVLELPGVRL